MSLLRLIKILIAVKILNKAGYSSATLVSTFYYDGYKGIYDILKGESLRR